MSSFGENTPFFSHPPNGAEVLDLSGILHDARVVSIETDPENGDCRLNCTIYHVSKQLGISTDTVYTFTLKSCARFVVIGHVKKPGATAVYYSKGSTDERLREYYKLYCAVSAEVATWMKEVADIGDGDIYDAEWLHAEGMETMRIGMSLKSATQWYVVELSGLSLECSREGWQGSLEEIGAVASEYWKDFTQRSAPE